MERKSRSPPRPSCAYQLLFFVAFVVVVDGQQKVIVPTTNGMLQGLNSNGINYFRGVPYAAPPTGKLRWKPPQPVTPWAGVRDAVSYGNSQALEFEFDSNSFFYLFEKRLGVCKFLPKEYLQHSKRARIACISMCTPRLMLQTSRSWFGFTGDPLLRALYVLFMLVTVFVRYSSTLDCRRLWFLCVSFSSTSLFSCLVLYFFRFSFLLSHYNIGRLL